MPAGTTTPMGPASAAAAAASPSLRTIAHPPVGTGVDEVRGRFTRLLPTSNGPLVPFSAAERENGPPSLTPRDAAATARAPGHGQPAFGTGASATTSRPLRAARAA